ncbi:MAG TPA: APC family permease [Acidimicrobiales bacterium]|nr:APC family permease [Acidimicrobiales bacterium]
MVTATTTEPAARHRRPPRTLRRNVGFFGLTAFSVGSVVGSRWFLATLAAARFAGPASIASWVLAAFMLVFVALMYAELAAAYPVSGGTARYSQLCFGSAGGFVASWMSWLQAVTLAPVETEAAVEYLGPKWHGVFDDKPGVLTGKGFVVAVLFVLFFTVVNLAGIRWVTRLNRVAVPWKLLVPLVAVVALALTSFHSSNFHTAGGFAPFGAQGIFKALPGGVVFALFGFEQPAQLGGEARNPQRDLPRAIVAAVLIGMLLYLCLEIVLIGALAPRDLTSAASWANPLGALGSYGPYAQIATALGLGWLAVLLYSDAVVSPAGTGLLYIATTSRITYSMNRSGTLPRALGYLDRRGAPWLSVLLASGFGIVILVPFGGWQKLVEFISSATAFMYAFAPLSVAALRHSDPGRPRPYRVPAAWLLAPLAFVFANLIIYWGGWPTVWRLAVGIVLGVTLMAIARATTSPQYRAPLKLAPASWVVPWVAGLLLLDAIGPAYVQSWRHVLPFWWDMLAVAIFSLVIFYVAQSTALGRREVARNIAEMGMTTSQNEIDQGIGA